MVVEMTRQNSGAHLVKKPDFLPRIESLRGIAAVTGFVFCAERRSDNLTGIWLVDALAFRARRGISISTHG
jgi:hypothetical protein